MSVKKKVATTIKIPKFGEVGYTFKINATIADIEYDGNGDETMLLQVQFGQDVISEWWEKDELIDLIVQHGGINHRESILLDKIAQTEKQLADLRKQLDKCR